MEFSITGIIRKILSLAILSVPLTLLALAACSGGGSSPTSVAPSAPAAAAVLTATFNPPVGTPLLTTDTLTVTFNQAVSSVPATMAPAGGTWNAANTVYTFPPTALAAAGPLSISVNAATTDGTQQASLGNVEFNVYDPTATPFVYVSTAGSDSSGNGTSALPYATIAKAESVAVSGQAVLVAGGTYTVDSGAPTNVVMTDGVSLYGGYAADFSSRDPAVNVTTITDVATTAATSLIATDFGSSSGCGAAAGTPMAAVSVGTLSVPMTIDGFTINGSANFATVDSAAVSIDNNGGSVLILSNDTLNGGAGSAFSVGVYDVAGSYNLVSDTVNGGSSAGMSLGIYTGGNSGSDTVNALYSSINGGTGGTSVAVFNDDFGDIYPNLSNNTIAGGSGADSYGVYNVPNCPAYTYPVLLNNTISGGSGSTSSTAYFGENWVDADIFNNTIDGGSGPVSTGIYLTDSATANVWNDTVSGGSGATSSTAISNSLSGNADIEDSILFVTSTAGTQICYNNVDGLPAASINPTTTEIFYNNDVSPSCATALYSYAGTRVTTLAVQTTTNNTAPTLAAMGNVSANPGFVSASDWHLTAASPAEVLQGGLNLTGVSGTYNPNIPEPLTDKDGVVRTAAVTLTPANIGGAGISMGAYERN
jgi:hypothetical protein